MKIMSVIVWLCVLVSTATSQKNVLLIIADDVGLDNIGAYGVNPDAATTPNIDQLAEDGVLFRRAYGNPTCSPTRATILTGRRAWRTGMGNAFGAQSTDKLILTAPTIADVMQAAGYRTAAVGKWHMGNDPLHPLAAGFEQHLGSLANIPDYFNYVKNVSGVLGGSTNYAPTETVDDALSLMSQFGQDKWFLWVGFNSAHAPFHAPPPSLHGYALPAMVPGNEPIHTKAMIEAMDAEIGRLLAAVDPTNTVVIFVGDNGPDSLSVTPPWDPTHAKHSVYDLGIHVALIIAGGGPLKNVENHALVNTTDLYATIAIVAEASSEAALDSINLRPYLRFLDLPSMRQYAYSELFVPNFDPAAGWPGVFSIRRQSAIGRRYKLNYEFLPFTTQVDPAKRELFDLKNDPFETVNLLAAPLSSEVTKIYSQLRAFLVGQGPSPWTDQGGSLPGTGGAPLLQGEGSLVPGTKGAFEVTGALPQATGTLFIGLSLLNQPFQCGILAPSPDITKPLTIALNGEDSFPFVTPSLGGSVPIYVQAWINDPGGPCEYSASNLLVGTLAP